MRIGIFGGTFDPIHYGHLICAEQSREQANLDQVWFVPAPRPPHKLEYDLTRYDQRVEMLQLAIAGQSTFRVENVEEDRDGPSYTVDTLEELHRRHPNDKFFLIVGSDTLADLHTWYRPDRLLELAGLVVMTRPGSRVLSEQELREQVAIAGSQTVSVQVIETPLIEIASRDLRKRIGRGQSVRYFLPRAVECYAMEKRLYALGTR